MSSTHKIFTLSAIALAVTLTACSDPSSDDGLTCESPQIINAAGTACEAPASEAALIVPAANQAVVYYKRDEGDYDGWGLHLWGDEMAEEGITWDLPLTRDGIHPLYGAYYLVDLTVDDWTGFNFIVHKGGEKDIGGADLVYSRAEFGEDVFGLQGVAELFPDPMLEVPVVLNGAAAHFVDLVDNGAASILFTPKKRTNRVQLWHSESASLSFDSETKTVSGGSAIDLFYQPMSKAQSEALPHLAGLDGYWIDQTSDEVKQLLKEQLWVVEFGSNGEAVQLTRVQTANILDTLYYNDAKTTQLGAFDNGSGQTRFSLWAPTAQSLSVQVFNAPTDLVAEETLAMTEDAVTGVWSVDAATDLNGKYYIYDVEVFHHVNDEVVQETVTDPYSLSLSMNSVFSQVVDLTDPTLEPIAGWTVDKTFDDVTNPEDISVYETHVRDLSLWDASGTTEYNGKFKAFTESARESMSHLTDLRTAGLTAVQILPAFDIATIEEGESFRVDIDASVADYCALSTEAAAKAAALSFSCADDITTIQVALEGLDVTTGEAQDFYSHLRGVDSFNWGYDPFHYTVPEGSYSTDPEGTTRIVEFREMVQSLHDMDYMVVMDVVYNHTNASGLAEKSVLDKVVPGYYHRRDIASGAVLKDSCCDDTATEHKMMSKLMTDSLIVWARDYQVDAFRFDLMGLQTLTAMNEALAAVKVVNPDVYFYGEGWDYGAAGENGRGKNASQSNIAGTEIGTFTDRLRDGVRGGGPFDNMDGDEKSLRRNQGLSNSAIANELNLVGSIDPDAGTEDDDSLNPAEELAKNILENSDLVRLGLAGNLKSYEFTNYKDKTIKGEKVDYNGQNAGYANDPQEIVNYVSKHDNQTLWDIIAYKADETVTSVQRTRMQALSVATGAFAQGVPFYHMGVDLLRSKSMERDSYDSGDWFNKVDFAENADSNWNVGLPREDKDGSNWDIIETIIADTDANPTVDDVNWMRAQFLEMLTIRASSPLFRLTNAADINERVKFHNTGSTQTPGVIVMEITDGTTVATDYDSAVDSIVVVFNYTASAQTMEVTGATGFVQHAAQSETTGVSFNEATSEFTVPALTTAVFVDAQDGSYADIAPFGDTTLFAVGSISSWSPVYDGYYAGDGVYKFAVNIEAAGDFTFRFADASFGSNTNADSFTNGVGSAFTLTAAGDGDNNFALTVADGEEGDYEFTLDLSNTVPEITIEAKDYALALDVYVRGSITDASWNAVPAGLFTYNNAGEYTIWIDAVAGDYSFKIADADWTDGTNFGAGSVTDVTLGEALLLDGSNNIDITVPSDNYYEFKLDTAKSLSAPELTVTADAPTHGAGNTIFVQGEVGAAVNSMTYIGLGEYETEFTVDPANFAGWGNAGNFDFKIANSDFSNPNLGDSLAVTLPVGYTVANAGGNNGVAGITVPTTLKFTYNALEGSVLIELAVP